MSAQAKTVIHYNTIKVLPINLPISHRVALVVKQVLQIPTRQSLWMGDPRMIWLKSLFVKGGFERWLVKIS